MTLWQDPPPQTRRQARENERAAAQKSEDAAQSRRVGTVEPTPAGQIPIVTPSQVRPDVPVSDAPAPSVPSTEVPATPVAGQQASETPTPQAAIPATPVVDERADSDAHTMTRRELRALRQSQPDSNATVAGEAPASEASRESTTEDPAPVEPAPVEPTPGGIAATDTAEARTGEPALAPPTSAATAAAVSARSFSDILSGANDQAPPTDEPVAFRPSTGHWSNGSGQSDQADDAQQAPGYQRSRVSSGSVTSSNALILPTVPSIADATGPLTSTGEILVTGSIDLPRGLGATGHGSSRFDSSDIDRLFDQPEAEQTGPDVTPIRASRAVSTHTSTRDTITPRRSRGNKLPMALAITAAVLAIGVVGLLIAGYVFRVF